MKTVGLTFTAVDPDVELAAEKCTCPHCGNEYKSKESLAKHIKDKHPDCAHS